MFTGRKALQIIGFAGMLFAGAGLLTGCAQTAKMTEDINRTCSSYVRTTTTDQEGKQVVTEQYTGDYKEDIERGIKRKTKDSDTKLKKFDVKCGDVSLSIDTYGQKMNPEAITAKGDSVEKNIKAAAQLLQEIEEAYLAANTGGASTLVTNN